ncbi:GIY-YIG nuclease family protein [Marinicrinis lubricantis]|uniref:GIY-YIG nuclease family protein n=1 Tax=Marinicrinis lubricantis TaxID=2086470 RepID=A0ABW1INI6_9BACL
MVSNRKEMVQQYLEMKTESGVYQIQNVINQKRFVASSRNLRTLNGVKFQLNFGSHKNHELQQEWTKFGEDAFQIEILETLKKKKDDPFFNEKEELKKLEQKWLDQLKPYGERGYHKEIV